MTLAGAGKFYSGDSAVNKTVTIPYSLTEKYVLAEEITDRYLPLAGTENVKRYTLRKIVEKQLLPHSGKRYQTEWLFPLLQKLQMSTLEEDVEETLLVEYRKIIPTLKGAQYTTKKVRLNDVRTTALKHLEHVVPFTGKFNENRIAGLVIQQGVHYFLIDGHHRYKTLTLSNTKTATYIVARIDEGSLKPK